MRALTLTQPWASLIAVGAKRIETRSWTTGYRGPLAIHAAKGYPGNARGLVNVEPFRSALDGEELPLGAVLAVVELVDVLQIAGSLPADVLARFEHSRSEQAFGDYSEGRYAWMLGMVAPLARPVLARGSLGLWEWSR